MLSRMFVMAVVGMLAACQATEDALDKVKVGTADGSGTFDGTWTGKRLRDGGSCISPVEMTARIAQGIVQVEMPSYSIGVLRGRVDGSGAITFDGTLSNGHVYRYSGTHANGKFEGHWAVLTSSCSGTIWYLERKGA